MGKGRKIEERKKWCISLLRVYTISTCATGGLGDNEILGPIVVTCSSNSHHGNSIPRHLDWKTLSALLPCTSLPGT